MEELYVRLLLAVLKADGQSHPAEESLLEWVIDHLRLSPEVKSRLGAMLSSEADLGDTVEDLPIPATIDSRSLLWLLRDAAIMAAAGGQIVEARVEILRAFLRRLSLDEDKIAKLIDWVIEEASHHAQGLRLLEE